MIIYMCIYINTKVTREYQRCRDPDDVMTRPQLRGEAPEPPPLLCHPAQWLSGSTEPQKALEGEGSWAKRVRIWVGAEVEIWNVLGRWQILGDGSLEGPQWIPMSKYVNHSDACDTVTCRTWQDSFEPIPTSSWTQVIRLELKGLGHSAPFWTMLKVASCCLTCWIWGGPWASAAETRSIWTPISSKSLAISWMTCCSLAMSTSSRYSHFSKPKKSAESREACQLFKPEIFLCRNIKDWLGVRPQRTLQRRVDGLHWKFTEQNARHCETLRDALPMCNTLQYQIPMTLLDLLDVVPGLYQMQCTRCSFWMPGRALPPAFVNAFGASPSKSPKLLGSFLSQDSIKRKMSCTSLQIFAWLENNMNNPSLSNRCIFGTARLHDLGGCRADQKSSNGTSTERRTTGRSGISGCRNTSDLMWRRMDYNFSHDLKMENDLQLVFCFSNPWSLHGLCMVLLCVAMC